MGGGRCYRTGGELVCRVKEGVRCCGGEAGYICGMVWVRMGCDGVSDGHGVALKKLEVQMKY